MALNNFECNQLVPLHFKGLFDNLHFLLYPLQYSFFIWYQFCHSCLIINRPLLDNHKSLFSMRMAYHSAPGTDILNYFVKLLIHSPYLIYQFITIVNRYHHCYRPSFVRSSILTRLFDKYFPLYIHCSQTNHETYFTDSLAVFFCFSAQHFSL